MVSISVKMVKKKKKTSLYLYFSRVLLVLCSTAEVKNIFLACVRREGGGGKVMRGDFQLWN